MGKYLGREFASHLQRNRPGVQQLEDRPVIGGIHHRQHRLVVLGGRSQHRRAANVDVLDGVVEAHAGARYGGVEGIEVNGYEVEGLDAAGGERGHVGRLVPARQQPGVDRGVERLDPSVQDLGESGDLVHRGDPDSTLSERGCRAAC